MLSSIIIPARMDSSRFPGKPLAKLKDSTVLKQTVMRAASCRADRVVITSPDHQIGEYCARQGWCADTKPISFFPSSNDCINGTHRCAEVAARMHPEVQIIVNWQVDEPFIAIAAVDRMIASMYWRLDAQESGDPEPPVTTLAARMMSSKERKALDEDHNRVKVRLSLDGTAQTFTRAKLPGAHEHVGIYCYSRRALMALTTLKPTALADLESLEQMTWVDHGLSIQAYETGPAVAINSPEDLARV